MFSSVSKINFKCLMPDTEQATVFINARDENGEVCFSLQYNLSQDECADLLQTVKSLSQVVPGK